MNAQEVANICQHEEETIKKDRVGKWFLVIGFAILFVGLLASFIPNIIAGNRADGILGQFVQQWWPYISFAALPLGFASIGIGAFMLFLARK